MKQQHSPAATATATNKIGNKWKCFVVFNLPFYSRLLSYHMGRHIHRCVLTVVDFIVERDVLLTKTYMQIFIHLFYYHVIPYRK